MVKLRNRQVSSDEITELDIQMFHDIESWIPTYFAVKGHGSQTVPAWVFALL